MARYVKRPVVVEAIQWAGDNIEDINKFTGGGIVFRADGKISIPTLEGDMLANKGDMIIKGVKSELYPCKLDIFKKTYQRIPDKA